MKNSPCKQLLIDLGLSADQPVYLQFKDVVRRLSIDIFDLSLTLSAQPERAKLFNDQVAQAFPDIFNVAPKLLEKRLKAVHVYVGKSFYARRHLQKKQMEEIDKAKMHLRLSTMLKGQNCSSPISFRRCRASSMNPSSSPNASSSSCNSTKHIQSSPGDGSISTSSSHEDLGSPLADMEQEGDEAMNLSSISISSPISTATPPIGSSSISSYGSNSSFNSSSIRTNANDASIEQVKNFLASCKPDMQHLLQTFINFGCNSQEYLTSISERSSNEIEEFLRALVVVPKPNGASQAINGTQGKLSEMDILVLKWQFKQCGDRM